MADDNVFDFEAFRKKLEELKEQQEKVSERNKEDVQKLIDMYKSVFMPSPEDLSKAANQMASALEKAAEVLKETYKAPTKNKKDEEGEE